ncbi:protein fantom [Nelusetta ayraudi]|uniref:protein fantom n=1 Tax=Nelusetta ayraudi TaxID=303726 RepID=UPI003F6F1B8C
MSPVVDETADDLPVRDVGLMRGGLMPTIPDTLRDVKPWKKHLTKPKDPQRFFRFPREHLEDLCVRLQEENSTLRQHTRTQEQRLRRMSTKLIHLRQTNPSSTAVKDRDMEDTIQELETRVAKLECQKEALQNKLSMAKQHIMDLGGCTPYRIGKGRTMEAEGGVRRATQTAPPHFRSVLEDTRMEMERLRSSVTEQVRVAELELTATALRDTLREKEKEIEGTMKEIRKQHADRLRSSIRENVDLIRLQKQLSEKSTALRVMEEKFNNLQEAYEHQLEESQQPLRESQEALLKKVEELTEQLKQQRERALAVEGQLTTSTLSLQTQDKLHERIADLEEERDLIKDNYNTLLEKTLSVQCKRDSPVDKHKEVSQRKEAHDDTSGRVDIMMLEGRLQEEMGERRRLELELEKLQRGTVTLEEQGERERGRRLSSLARNTNEHLEREVLRYKHQVSALQERLDSVTKEFDMSVEELSETLVQIKTFRMQQESRMGLPFLSDDVKVGDPPQELATMQASHAETVLELRKTTHLLLVEHQICKDLQEELNTVKQRTEREKEENRKRMAEKDRILSKRALQINTLQAQLKELAYNPRNYKRTMPIQYTWPAGDQEVMQDDDSDLPFSQLRAGESLLEIHIKGATFTPAGLRIMGSIQPEAGREQSGDIVTFCTYSLLDFEVHSTPLVSGSQPSYSFTSRYAVTARDLGKLGGQGLRVRAELHQALGGVRFVTHGSGLIPLAGAVEKRGEHVTGCVNISGSEGEIVGILDFWVRLFHPAEPVDSVVERGAATHRQRSPGHVSLGWQDTCHEDLHDYGGGVPNELVIMLERCMGLSTRWPGLYPDAYLTYRLYDLQPHVSQVTQCNADPVFNDITSFPLAVTADVLQYLRSSSLWVYVYDDSDDQVPPVYLAKTPVPLRSLATGREIRGDYVLRDPAGGPRGMARVMIRWKYPFHPSVGTLVDHQDAVMESSDRMDRRREKAEESQQPIAKPRIKTQLFERPAKTVQKETKSEASVSKKSSRTSRLSSGGRKSTKTLHDSYQYTSNLTPDSRLISSSHLPSRKASEETSSRKSVTTLSRKSSAGDTSMQVVDQLSSNEEEDRSHSESSSSQSDIVIIPPKRPTRKGNKMRVEILSLTFEPSSHVALDKSVQRVYVEYRLLGVPIETTETPMSLRKPTKGEEIHYNFTRVIYVDGSHSAPLRQYLHTMLEGSDPNHGRLKFTVVSEPMDDEDECVDVGNAYLDLQELLLTGNDVIEQRIDIASVDDDKEIIGNLKVSLEAARALDVIYKEFHQGGTTQKEGETDEEKEAEEENGEEDEQEQERNSNQLQLIDYVNDSSDFD